VANLSEYLPKIQFYHSYFAELLALGIAPDIRPSEMSFRFPFERSVILAMRAGSATGIRTPV